MTTPATPNIDQMFAQATGQTASPASAPAASATPTAPPATLSADGPNLPPQTSTAAPMPPEAEAASANATIDQMFAQATGQTADTSTTSTGGGAPPPSGGFVQGLDEGTGGIKQAITASNQNALAQNERALDIYHQMIAAHAAGDSKGATESASKFLLTVAQQNLQKAYAPFVEAAKMVVLDPIKAVQDTRAQMRQAGNGDMAAGAANEAKAVWNKAKQDWESGSPDRADQVLTDVASGISNNAGMNAVPLFGPMISSMSNNLNEATHRPGGEDRGRILGNAIGAGLTALVGEGVGAIGKLLPAGKRVAEGLAEGEAGSAAAQTAADTAKAHDNILQSNKDNFQAQLDNSIQQAQDVKAKATEANSANTVEKGNQDRERTAEHKSVVEAGRDAQHAAIDDSLAKAKQEYADQFKQTLSTQTVGAADPEELAVNINKGINKYEENSHTDFEGGMTGGDPNNPTEDSVMGQLAGQSEPVMGSPFQEMAAERIRKPVPDDHPYAHDAADLANDKIDPKLAAKLENWAKGVQDVETNGPVDASGKPTRIVVKKPVGDFTADQLVKIRQSLRKSAAALQRGDINRNIYGDMIGAVDDTLQKLAESAHNPDVLQQYEKLRTNYKTARANLDSSVADKLRLDSPDKALGNANKFLLQGGNAAAKIRTIGSMVGEETMQGLRQTYLQQLAEMGPEEAAKALAKIPADVKQAFFGPELDGRLAAAQSVYDKSVASAEAEAAARKNYVSNAADEAVGRQSVQAKYDRQAVSANAQKATAQIATDYNTAAQAAKDLHATQNAPYSTKFANAISDGSIGDKLAADKISTEDITALKGALDPKDYAAIQRGIVNRQMSAATTAGHFNPAKFLDWYDSIPEPSRNAFFSDTAGTPMQIDISGIRDASKVQKLARAGLVTLGTAAGGAAASIVPHTALAGLLEVAAATAGGAVAVSKKELITNLLDTVATNPRLLTNMSKVMPAIKATAKATNAATRAATVAGPVLGPSFGRQVTVDGQPGTQVGIHPESKKPVIMYHPQDAQ